MRSIDLTGKRFGRLTVIGLAERSHDGRIKWRCKCDCGNEISVLTFTLNNGRSKSCGCFQKDRASEVHKKHGQHGTRLYRIWSNMNQRCNNPKNEYYRLYGAKGVAVCDEWRNANSFINWAIANGYSDNLTIDRIDNDKGYSPENCRWTTPQVQTDNRACTRYISFNGKTQTVKRWSEETGIAYNLLMWRLDHGWTIERTLTKGRR